MTVPPMMEDPVRIGEDKYIPKKELLGHLKMYNYYHEGQTAQLRHREEEEELIIEGLLNISWGLRRPIRLQMQDDNERIRPPPSSTSWHSGCSVETQRPTKLTWVLPDIKVDELDSPPETSGSTAPDDADAQDSGSSDLCSSQLMRTKSDAGVLRRDKLRTAGDQRRLRRHRFSINGHFYNHKTSVFTPAFGSITNVRINSTMSTVQVLNLLLNKFKIENSSDEFALYVVHASEERTKLKDSDYPLIARILQGPCEAISKIFLMEKDLEEVTYDVAQYIKFEMPVLQSFIVKLKEEEDREVKKLTRKYSVLRAVIETRVQELTESWAQI
ncbi:ras association domain-containing protein 2 [Amblyraja radiata]|uniref:ras association domain-containing protein 2 n=1 Tax=Amblyraja radiata TaxID=386614 RepID=UPI0014024437|nr:ras association domain-containing protein 2 [Amblyraja radiata]